jgi:hypothetical protein
MLLAVGCASSKDKVSTQSPELTSTTGKTAPTRIAIAAQPADDDCVYEEAFDKTPKDWTCDGLTVKWCQDGLEWTGKNGCTAKGSLEIQPGTADTTRLWYHFGDKKPKALRIEFSYGQWAGKPPDFVPSTSYLEYKMSKDDEFNCPRTGYKEAKELTKTWDNSPECTAENFELPIEKEVRAVYFQFRKRRPSSGQGIVMMLDDLKITLVPQDEPARR